MNRIVVCVVYGYDCKARSTGEQTRNIVQSKHRCKGVVMDKELMLDVSQAHEFKLACRRSGYTNADIKRMCEGDLLKRLLPTVRGIAEVVQREHIIDLDSPPFVPDGWKVEEHHRGGSFEWNPEKVSLFLTEEQQRGSYIRAHGLRKEFEGRNPFNANCLDYLLKHQELILEDWKWKQVFFWGTIYRDPRGHLCVRCLSWRDGRWRWRYCWLDGDFSVNRPAAVPASLPT